MNERKLNAKQLFSVIVLAITTPIVRGYSIYLSQIGQERAWIGVIVGIIPIILLVYVIKYMYDNNPNKRMEDIVCNVLGNFLGKFVLIIIIIWGMLIVCMHTRILRFTIYFFYIYVISNRIFFSRIFRIVFYNC